MIKCVNSTYFIKSVQNRLLKKCPIVPLKLHIDVTKISSEDQRDERRTSIINILLVFLLYCLS